MNNLAIYGIGLAKRDRTLARLQATLRSVSAAATNIRLHPRARRAPGTPRAGAPREHFSIDVRPYLLFALGYRHISSVEAMMIVFPDEDQFSGSPWPPKAKSRVHLCLPTTRP